MLQVACAQLSTTNDKHNNLQKAVTFIEKANKSGAKLVMFPEMYMSYTFQKSRTQLQKMAEPLDGPFVTGLCEAASDNHMYVICGILEVSSPNYESVYNTVIIIDPKGKIISSYRKTHLCNSWNVKESDLFEAGTEPFKVQDTAIGRIGLLICYELRFPEISRYLTLHDIDILFIPSAWYQGPLKEEHWEILLRSRAIENTVFVCASNQAGDPFCGKSMVIDPMGVILASAGEEDQLITTEIDLERVKRTRNKNPCLSNRVSTIFN